MMPTYQAWPSNRLSIVGLLVVLTLAPCACASSDGGSVSASFSFEEPPEETVWIWAKVVVDKEGHKDGSSLASDGPHEYAPGAKLSVELDGVLHGTHRRVVVEIRDGPSPNLPVVYYGISARFSLAPGKSKTVNVHVPLRRPAGSGSVRVLFDDDEFSAVGLQDIQKAKIVVESTNASTLLLSNSVSFGVVDSVRIEEGAEEIPCEHDSSGTDIVSTCEYPGWNLLAGLFAGPDDAVDGRYFVYVKFIDENGYEGGIASASVTLDTTPPEVMSASILKYQEEGMEHAIVFLAADEVIDVDPKNSQLTVEPAGEGSPLFAGPQRVGLSTSYQWHAQTEIGDDDKSTYTFSVRLMDGLGNLGAWTDLDDGEDGSPLQYQKGCDCSDGPCCDGCYFLPDTTICDGSGEMEYGCPMGTGCGDDVYGRSLSTLCSGQSAACNGGKPSWHLAVYCDQTEMCSEDEATCIASESCDCDEPVVHSVEPVSAQLYQQAMFTVSGCGLPLSAVAWVANCQNIAYGNHASHEFTFTCTPSAGTGPMEGHIKSHAGGTLLHQFDVLFFE